MSRQRARKEKDNAKAPSSKGVEDVRCSSIFGQYSVEEMITQLKGLALDPSMPQFARDNIQPLWNQILGLRKLMILEDSEMPWRKRKLDQLVKDRLRAPAGFVSPNQQNITKRRRRQLSQASSLSCLLNSVDSAQSHDEKFIFESHTSGSLVTFDGALLEIQVTTECSFADDVVDLKCTSKDVSPVVDSDESVNGSNPSSPEDSTPNEARRLGISKVVRNLNSPTLSGAQRKHLEPSRRSIRLLNFIGDHLQRKAIPVGPRFQTDVPEWDDTVDRSILISSYNSDSDNLKWLGSQVWPTENGNIKSTVRRIGKGRHNSCSCASRASTDCIKRHVLEERLLLQRNLGPAFSSWKFDEMGEQVSESWSLKEQQTYESLMKKRPSANGKSFWMRTLKCFPRKSKKDIVNYYFNVYIPHRMSLHRTSPTIKQVDTDDEDEDEAENSDHTGSQKRAEGRSPTIPNKKARYLRTS
ncbi:uncharacterized protein LOC131022583 [Salvia miltiorrhiza]|uniref:uncharacterized protein LOC131022583 n=1 Tax=Salvia miltiorrhiza TaxID=226208 RepID=UPI0025ABDB8C|nr:uncharacterized protein LOC131022583 [Salvia miltiorrhiza]XP_057808078.1 uncharacterized protein LOC131022583 [Salvia miltiorrhiza]XP_057808079.1 uncharacterized protein LOC131022583 [Salvia miltiorrhiza]